MPLNKLFVRAEELQREEDALRKQEIEEQLIALFDEEEVYDSKAWEVLDAMLLQGQEEAFKDMMGGDIDGVMLARERAKVYSKLRQRRKDVLEEIDKLRAERQALEE